MRILYISSDPGICIDQDYGAGAHIQETVKALNSLGHEVYTVASDCQHDIPIRLPGKRIKRHCWFSSLTALRSSLSKTKYCTDAKSNLSITDEPNYVHFKKTDEGNDSRSNFRGKLSGIFYGKFRESLNLLEEKLVYRERFVKQVTAAINTFIPDAVYERYALGNHEISSLCNNLGIPYILEVNALLAREAADQGKLSPFQHIFACRQELRFLRNSKKVFVVSKHLKNIIGPKNSNVMLHPNGVDIDMFHPSVDPTPVHKRHGLKDVPILGWVGSFGHSRGIEELLSITAQIHKKRSDIRFIIVGDGILKNWVETQIKKMGLEDVIILTGKVSREEIPKYISAMDIALAPYPAHGAEYFSPLKVFEYMAMAKLVAATSVGQCSELLGDGTGLLLSPERHDIWAEAIISLLNDPERCRNMGIRAREKVKMSYTWKANAERIISTFEAIMPKGYEKV